MIDSKVCSKCGEGKPVTCFYRKTGAKDGRNSRCNTCKNKGRSYKGNSAYRYGSMYGSW